MSTLKHPSAAAAEITEGSIATYLQTHPDFFERHLGLLTNLRLPHRTGGPAISLLERQVTVLRQRNLQLERKLKELVDVARGNDELAAKLHQLTLALLGAGSRKAATAVLEQQLRLSFRADEALLVLFAGDEAASGADEEAAAERFVRVCAREAGELAPFRTFLQAATPRCGQIRDAQRNFLFGHRAAEIGSAALLPLGAGASLGFLAIGSRDVEHFHPGKGVDFLARLGEIVACSLARD